MPEKDSPPQVTASARSVALAIFLMTASFVLVKTGRDALFVEEQGVYDLPLAYLVIAGMSLPVAVGMLALLRAAGPRRARVLALAGVSVLLGVYWRIAEPGGGARMTAVFASIPLLYGVLFAAAWLLAAELFDGVSEEEVSRAYARIGAGSIAGGLVGGVAARVLASAVAPQDYFALAAVVLAAATVRIAMTQARHPPRPVAPAPSERPGLAAARSFLRRRYGLLLFWAGVLGAIVGVLIEFQFYWAASTSGASGREHSRYFANLHLLLNGGALVVQLVVMPRLQRSLGMTGNLLVMPAVLLGGAVLAAFSAGLVVRGALRVTEGGLKASIHRASWEQAFLPAGPDRDVAKLVVDGMGAHLGEGVVAVLLYLWLGGFLGMSAHGEPEGAWLGWLLVVLVGLFFVITARLGPSLRASRVSGPSDEVAASLPPGGCVVTATLGWRVQSEECRRRHGGSLQPAGGEVAAARPRR